MLSSKQRLRRALIDGDRSKTRRIIDAADRSPSPPSSPMNKEIPNCLRPAPVDCTAVSSTFIQLDVTNDKAKFADFVFNAYNQCISPTKVTEIASPKKVGFSPRVTVILIPERKEYVSAKLADSLWWKPEDFDSFKDQAKHERLMRSFYPDIHTKPVAVNFSL